MPSHLHLVFKSTIQKPQELIRDFKSFTSKEMIKLIQENQEESRKEWLINSFKKAALQKSNAHQHQFWQHDNHPIELWSAAVIDQKINYIHDNPVDAGFVEKSHEYLYSGARNYEDTKSLIKIITA